MAAPLSLRATQRAELHKHVHALRRRGEVPAVLYGHNVEPLALTTESKALEKVWHRAGRTHLVDLTVDGGRARKVQIRELQIDPRSARLLHADFFAVNLREKLSVDIPIVPVGESPAVSEQKIGVLQQIMSTVKVECLPSDIPGQLTVDVSGLTEIDQGVHLRDIALPQGVAWAHGVDPDELVVKVSALRVQVEEEEEAAAAAEEAPAEGEAAAAPAEEAAAAE
ncbi:MAG TPA: 50S ribosomal protein L25 [Candidatus Dormibacteraeota bacterium]|nr:50S ribosomal protein L25 [Candidatus Dormibacteraeota bacterium]